MVFGQSLTAKADPNSAHLERNKVPTFSYSLKEGKETMLLLRYISMLNDPCSINVVDIYISSTLCLEYDLADCIYTVCTLVYSEESRIYLIFRST